MFINVCVIHAHRKALVIVQFQSLLQFITVAKCNAEEVKRFTCCKRMVGVY